MAEKNIVDKYRAYLLSKVVKIKDRQKPASLFIRAVEMTKKRKDPMTKTPIRKREKTARLVLPIISCLVFILMLAGTSFAEMKKGEKLVIIGCSGAGGPAAMRSRQLMPDIGR